MKFPEYCSFEKIKITTHFQKKLWKVLVFLGKFAALSLPLHFLLWANFDAAYMQTFVAKAVERLLLYSGIEVSRNGMLLAMNTKTGALTVEVIKDCIGWKSILALFGLIFATPKIAFKKRILGFLAGAPVIFLGNLLRIYATVCFTVFRGVEFWEITHTYLWQEGLMALVIATWYLWLNICKSSRS